MLTDARLSLFFIALSIVASLCSGETVYLTFPGNNSAEKVLKEDLQLRIREKEIAITELLQVNTASRDYNILSHPAGRRQYFIVVDLLYLNASQALEVRKLIQDFVS